MQSISNANFGPLVAYLVPGVTVLLGLSRFSPVLRGWLAATPPDAPTISGFLYLTVAALAIGMTVSAVRWAVVDTLHCVTGLPAPVLNFSRLAGKEAAFNLLIEIHYKHYLFYGNMVVATALAYACFRFQRWPSVALGWPDTAIVVLEAIFLTASRDTLRKYYDRSRQLLAALPATGTRRRRMGSSR